jgi:hypothetical protein
LTVVASPRHWLGFRAFSALRPNSAQIGDSLVAALEFTGTTWMKMFPFVHFSLREVCCFQFNALTTRSLRLSEINSPPDESAVADVSLVTP